MKQPEEKPVRLSGQLSPKAAKWWKKLRADTRIHERKRDALAIGLLDALRDQPVKPGDRLAVLFEAKLKAPYTHPDGWQHTHEDGECFLEIYITQAHLRAARSRAKRERTVAR